MPCGTVCQHSIPIRPDAQGLADQEEREPSTRAATQALAHETRGRGRGRGVKHVTQSNHTQRDEGGSVPHTEAQEGEKKRPRAKARAARQQERGEPGSGGDRRGPTTSSPLPSAAQ